jgi:hypothetical protein
MLRFEMEIIYRINHFRFFSILWSPILILILIGFANKDYHFFTIDNFSRSRIFGENYFLLSLSFVILITWMLKITFKVINSKGILFHKTADFYCIYNKPKFAIDEIEGCSIETRYLAKFLKIKLKNGNVEEIPLIFSIVEKADALKEFMRYAE